jgi:Tol biopolymer transport system component
MPDPLDRLTTALADRYAIEHEIGSGGMATVYLAQDVRHDRPVAIKVLRPDLAATLGPERFHREIRVAAQLQHPHILPLLDSGEADDFLYYVMPYVDGESLRDRLVEEGELPVGEAVRILRDVADALTEAHAHGVVHRDIKPENVLLRGRHALVTDFGVAKAVSEATGPVKLTTAGVALGTPAYMAPEQATADPHVDHRVDIYALGATAYELLTGRPVFMGRTPQQVLSAHVAETPQPVTSRRPSVPVALETVVMRCLEKRPADRFQSAEELLSQLEALATPSGGVTPTETRPVAAVGGRRRWLFPTAVGIVVVIVLAFVGTRVWERRPIAVSTSNLRAVAAELGREWHPALNPDGSQVAFVAMRDGRQSVVIKSTRGTVGSGELRPTQDLHDTHEWFPTWAPDGESLHFLACPSNPYRATGWANCATMQVGKLGGSIRRTDLPPSVHWASWSPDGSRIAYIARDDTINSSLFVRSLGDGSATLIASTDPTLDAIPSYHSPAWSPDGQRIAYVQGWPNATSVFTNSAGSMIWVADRAGGTPVRVTSPEFDVLSPTWLDAEHLLFVSDHDGPWEVFVIDVGPRGPRGAPRKVPGPTDAHTISYSTAGRTLAFSKATVRSNIWSYPLEVAGQSIAQGDPVTSDNASIESHHPSPDGRWIAYGTGGGSANVYRRPVEGGDPTPITDNPIPNRDPRWSHDGTEIAFVSGGGQRVMVVPADGGHARQVAEGIDAWLPAWSPDGRHLAFSSRESGQIETWVVSRPAVGSSWGEAAQITDDGCWPSDWAPDGKGVLCTRGYHRNGTELVLVSPEGETLWRYDLEAAGLSLPSTHQMFSRDGSTIYAAGTRQDDGDGIWAIPFHGGEPRLVVRFDDIELAALRWLSVGPDRLYLTVQEAEVDIWVADLEVER